MFAQVSAAVPIVSAVVHASASAHAAVTSSPLPAVAGPDWATLASVVAAVGTFAMALFTYDLAKKTGDSIKVAREAIAAEDVRQMNAAIPYLLLEVRDIPERPANEDDPGAVPVPIPPKRFVVPRTIQLWVRNIGTGFAQNIVMDLGPVCTKSISPPTALGVGQEAPLISQKPDVAIPGVTLTYDDAFGRRFESRTEIDKPVTVWSRCEWTPPYKTATAPPQ
jgi:hypothetical protein